MKRIDNEHGFAVDIIIAVLILVMLSAFLIPLLATRDSSTVVSDSIMTLAKSQEKFIVKSPGSFGTTSQEELRIAYFKGTHKDINLGVVVKEDIGYCLIGSLNNNSSEQKSVWYDSTLNGFVDIPENGTVVGGACDGISPDSPNVTWLR